MPLVVFPDKLLPRSEVVFSDSLGTTHRTGPRPRPAAPAAGEYPVTRTSVGVVH
jgi:hypothetical protein